jgi:hypothetical protein
VRYAATLSLASRRMGNIGQWTRLGRVFPRVLIIGIEHEALIDRILTTAVAITEEVRYTTGSVLPGGVHEDFIEEFESGEGTGRDGYKLVLSWLSGNLEFEFKRCKYTSRCARW